MKYITYYDSQSGRRSMSFAAVNKINYIARTLKNIGHNVDIIACGMNAKENIDATTEKIEDGVTVHYFKTRKMPKTKIMRWLNLIRNNIILFTRIISNIKKNEQVFAYHSLGCMRCIYWAKKIKGFKLILEVEEFYNDVSLKSKFSQRFEKKFIKSADKYIFPTELLNEKFNKSEKPYCIIHGTYQVENDRNVSFDDDKIHIVYAGTFDPRKGGAKATIDTAMYLSSNYHIHILGFGSKIDVENMKRLIYDVNKESEATVTYDGLLSGDEFIEFLQKCHIGMSTQNPDADFNDTSFPSKILTYMANGLRVASVKISVVEFSGLKNEMYFYEEQTPENIAKTIVGIDINDDYDSRKIIAELDRQFKSDLEILLEE